MNVHRALTRLLLAFAFAAFAGGLAFGVTTWLTPPSVSPHWIAVLVAGIAALGILLPGTVLNAAGRSGHSSRSPDTYYDLSLYLTKEEGWKD